MLLQQCCQFLLVISAFNHPHHIAYHFLLRIMQQQRIYILAQQHIRLVNFCLTALLAQNPVVFFWHAKLPPHIAVFVELRVTFLVNGRSDDKLLCQPNPVWCLFECLMIHHAVVQHHIIIVATFRFFSTVFYGNHFLHHIFLILGGNGFFFVVTQLVIAAFGIET